MASASLFVPQCGVQPTEQQQHHLHQPQPQQQQQQHLQPPPRSQTSRPMSILRKPSLPILSMSSLTDINGEDSRQLDSGCTMPTTPGSANFVFPPLPPLPPPSSCASDCPTPTTSTSSVFSDTTGRVRSRRSHVSFREDVDALEYKALRHRSGPPGSYTADPLTTTTPAQRRVSADNFQSLRRPPLAPRPVLKRAVSSQALRTNRDSDDDDLFEMFGPQTLRYPRVSPALARLSNASIPSPLWIPPTNGSSTPTTLTPTWSSATSPAMASLSGWPERKPRTPRSPIPSWSSAITSCPSLASSSHRASLASTLSAPSMTSLLLSPPALYDYGLPPSSPTLLDDGGSATAAVLDFDSIDGGGASGSLSGFRTRTFTGSFDPETRSASTTTAATFTADKHVVTTSRLRPRQSEPLSFSSSSEGSSSTTSTSSSRPRAAERLLRLQSSLADLRMQRRVEEARQAAGLAQAVEEEEDDIPQQPTSPSFSRARAPSPTLGELIRNGAAMLPAELDITSDDESDLDLSLPSLNAALRSHVIPSSSRLLVSASGKSNGQELQDGWSGSDSEEEEFSRTVARISLRKSSSLPARRVVKRPSLPASVTRSNRYSDIGVGADGAKPSAVKERSADVVASRRATTSAIPSARPSGTAALITALVEQKYATKESLPRPKRFVSGWGAPEVLEDDEWPPDKLNGKLETLSEVW